MPTARGASTSSSSRATISAEGYVTYQQDQYLDPIIPLIGEDNIIWGADYPHPDCIWPDSQRVLDKNLAQISPSVRRKITSENVSRLYHLN